jgi:hypothetical protein
MSISTPRRTAVALLVAAVASLGALSAPAGAAVDHSLYRSGQHLDVILPDREFTCTAAFTILIRSRPAGLTAGHCAPTRYLAVMRGYAGHPRSAIGLVYDSAFHGSLSDVDAAYFLFAKGVGFRQEVERGEQAPLRVSGWVPTAQQMTGTRACFAGRTSGADACGAIDGHQVDHLKCLTVQTRSGDSGGPVYLQTSNGMTRALGLVSVADDYKPHWWSRTRHLTCYEPIESILARFGATFPTG